MRTITRIFRGRNATLERRIAEVMLRGRWLDRAELDKLLAAVAARQVAR